MGLDLSFGVFQSVLSGTISSMQHYSGKQPVTPKVHVSQDMVTSRCVIQPVP